ncbi:MAG: KpsF/GutQ family sugar-phosphate isomerase [Puniceicoccales bacterium]|jgi:arabinose-5-phosphate isomerase|nr:KpsF/GutQ family sugar-phosphate isomerase [Puniceicoccales bacterium]
MSDENIQAGKHVLQCELKGLEQLLQSIEEPLAKTLALLSSCNRKIIVCGIGKSGHIGHKIVATLNSIGMRSIFLHPCEALHGDLGVYEPGDPVILISKSGNSEEIMRLIPLFKHHKSPIISILGNGNNPIASHSDVLFNTAVTSEGDPLGIIPTTSSLLALAAGDAIACALIAQRKFSRKDFGQFHPAGQIGRNLLLRVRDVMHPLKNTACVRETSPLRDVVVEMTEFSLGAALVLEKEQHLIGIITDGDIRRFLKDGHNIDITDARSVMNRNFRFISPDDCLGEAIRVMEEGSSQVHVLPVINGDLVSNLALGLIRLHDTYQKY